MTNEFMDTCMDCLSEISETVPMLVKGRKDLLISVDNEKELDKYDELWYSIYSRVLGHYFKVIEVIEVKYYK